MKKLRLSLMILAAGLFILSCDKKEEPITNIEEEVIELQEEETVLEYDISPKSDSGVSGTVKFTQKENEVVMELSMSGLTPGEHGIHIHEHDDCSADDGSSAGGHWNPTESDHGKWGEEHFHKGDIGNLIADENGDATLVFTSDHWCLNCEDETMNIVGRSLIIHADADDFHTQPTGNAGGRIGCVEIK